jgi:hypothetical protein
MKRRYAAPLLSSLPEPTRETSMCDGGELTEWHLPIGYLELEVTPDREREWFFKPADGGAALHVDEGCAS